MPKIFDDPKSIKTWAIKPANACGGQKVEKSIVLTSLNTKRLAELLDQFVQDHNENTMRIAQEIDLSNDEQQLADKRGGIMDNVLLMLFIVVAYLHIIGAWTMANWLADKVNFIYRLYQERKWRKQYDISNN